MPSRSAVVFVAVACAAVAPCSALSLSRSRSPQVATRGSVRTAPRAMLWRSRVGKHPAPAAAANALRGGCTALSSSAPDSAAAGPSASTPIIEALDRYVTKLFPFWVVGSVVAGMLFPQALAGFKDRYIELALGLTMVCMGCTLTVDDFKSVLARPKAVALGIFAQFMIMPSMGVLASKIFLYPRGLDVFAAGTILVGCCPGGTASNLVTLIAKADVALSVAMTACSTVLASVMTPLLASKLAGAAVPLDGWLLLTSTLRVVLFPVTVGMLLRTTAPKVTDKLEPVAPPLCVGLVALICSAIVSQNRAALLAGGGTAILPLVAAVITMHGGGFLFGYLLAYVTGLPEKVRRTVSIETGMQNSALGTVLALRAIGTSAAIAGAGVASGAALPGAISATVHSCLGSALAGYWNRKDKRDGAGGSEAAGASAKQ